MNVALRRPMTLSEFLAWEERQELRHEFDGFRPVAMTGESAPPPRSATVQVAVPASQVSRSWRADVSVEIDAEVANVSASSHW